MKLATFKQPYYLHTHQHLIPKDVLETIIIWFNVKNEYAYGKRIENSEKITCITLSVYQSINFVHYDEKKEKYICLVGDAAFGVPFFRSLNNGIICSRKLSLCIQLYFNEYFSAIHHGGFLSNLTFGLSKKINELHSKFNSDKPLNGYNQYVDILAKKEIMFAQNKANFLFATELMNKINGIVPWQVNKWSTSKLEYFKEKRNDNNEAEIKTNDEVCSIPMEDESYELVQEFDLVPSMNSLEVE